MPLFKLIAILFTMTVFASFAGLQIDSSGKTGFFIGFLVTMVFALAVFLFQTVYYISVSKIFIARGRNQIDDYQSPFDIWLSSIPFCVLMAVSAIWLEWHLVHVFFCSMLSLVGMLLGNALGRGSGRWDIRKSVPFFLGVIMSVLYLKLFEWMV